jgi:hypothetical protein
VSVPEQQLRKQQSNEDKNDLDPLKSAICKKKDSSSHQICDTYTKY